ncbi:LacI family DNA-binding transcriptional regulator [Streptomyces sp. NPDC093586]|uniref:LacI family DNA-binding transcriptional regulator n=1 Tax=Streptomyces sp. NPDC093586 TaxID=3366042 RepID=UPI0038272FDD
MKQRAGIADVAREAGVSIGTVSNVLNKPDIVADATRARVLAAVEQLGYVRNEVARVLRGSSSRLLALLVHDLTNPFCMALIQGAEETAREADMAVMVCNSAREAAEEARYLALLREHQVRGVLITPTDLSGSSVRVLERFQMPFVLMDHPGTGSEASCVAIDDVEGGQLAVQHLLDSGHRRIVFVSGPSYLPQVAYRRTGCQKALRLAGLSADSLQEISCPEMTVAAGQDAGRRLLTMTHRPSAVFCANDLLAMGVLQTLYEAGVLVPEDMAIVGCDDIEYASSAAVPLTSVHRPGKVMGAMAARQLLAATGRTHHRGPHRQIILRPSLTIRRSSPRTARPAARDAD